MGLGGLVPRMQGGGGLSRGQQDMLRQAQELSATSGQNPAQLQALTAQHGNLYGQGQQRRARRQMAGNQPGRSAMRGIGPGMAYGGVPRLQGGSQVPPPGPMGPPPGPALGGGGPNRLDALRGAPDIPLAGGPGIPGAGPGGDVIEEEGGTEGLPGAIVDTLMANTGGDPFQTLDILDQAVAMVEAELPEEDTGGVPDIEALLGGGGGGEPDIEALLGGGGGPDPMAMV